MVGVSPQRGLLALSVGDHMGNLITPFWALVGASIAASISACTSATG